MSNMDYTENETEIKSGYRGWLSAALTGVEFTIESLTETTGKVIASATPILSGVGSSFAIGFATYQGMMGITASHELSLSAAIFIAATVEGISFAGIQARDRVESYNRRTEDASAHLPKHAAEQLAYWTFLITFAIVAAFESIPGAYRWFLGEIQAEEALFRIALITLPLLSRIGAQIYSLTSLINSVDTSSSDREIRKLEDRLRQQKVLDEYNRQKAEADAKSAAKVAKTSGKMSVQMSGRSSDRLSGNLSDRSSDTSVSDNKSDILSDNSSDNRQQLILDILTEHISVGATEIHRLLGGDEVCAKSTVYEDLKALSDAGKIFNADRKWHIKPTIEALPELVGFSTNGLAH